MARFSHLTFLVLPVLLLLFTVTGVFSELPADVKKCAFGDSACLTATINTVLAKYSSTGIRSINLVPFDPLRIKVITFGKNPNSPVSLDLQFRNAQLIGLSNAKITRVAGFDKNLLDIVEVEASVPKLSLKGAYSADGQILVLPFVGKGDSNIIFTDLQIKVKLKVRPVEKAGKKYLHVDAATMALNPKHASFHLTGLFNNNKELGDNMLKFINENWSEILNELKPDISKALGLVVQSIVDNVFTKDSYESYFL